MLIDKITTTAQHQAALDCISFLMRIDPPVGSGDDAELCWLADLAAEFEEIHYPIELNAD